MADVPQFEHVPLNDASTQIRLVYVPLLDDPLKDGEILQCKLETFSLTEMHDIFTAVSYAWGDKGNSQTILLDAIPFDVSDNLWKFLHHISDREYEPLGSKNVRELKKIVRWFWIDQISIDQSRSKERNHQVRIMSNTYASAERVLVWLGSPVGFAAVSDGGPNNPELSLASNYTSRALYQHGHLLYYRKDIAQCRFWSRLWIVQEIMLGKEVSVCFGSYGMSWGGVISHFRRYGLISPAIVRRKAIPKPNDEQVRTP